MFTDRFRAEDKSTYNKNDYLSELVYWNLPVTSLGKWRQNDGEFEASLGYSDVVLKMKECMNE